MSAANTLEFGHMQRTIADIASAYDIARVYLFGSYARREATHESDIDLCLETGSAFSLLNAGSFASAVEDALKRTVDVTTERSLYPHVRDASIRDRVLLYERA